MTPDQRLMATAAGWLLGVLLLFGAGLGLGYQWRDRAARVQQAEQQQQRAIERATESEAARKREAAIHQGREDAIHAAQQDADAARAGADRYRRAFERLQQHPAARCGPGAHPTLAAPGPAALTTRDLPPDLLGRLGRAAGELAGHADQSRTAGLACERAYQALTLTPTH